MAPLPNEDNLQWTRSTALIDLEDPRLRLKAHSLTQLCPGAREAVVALYAFVKRIPFHKTYKLHLHTARAVLDMQRGDADDKATLLVALLRARGFPARLHYVALDGAVLRGLTGSISGIARPVVEVWVEGRWCATDTYIFDAAYVAGARERLAAQALDWGYGVGRHGATLWAAGADAFLTGPPQACADVFIASLGRFHDPDHFVHSAACKKQYGGLGRLLQWNILASRMASTVEAVRAQGRAGGAVRAQA
jgi:hypothetical protein